METSTQAEPSIEGRKRTKEDDRLVQDAREKMGDPSNFHRKRRSHERYTSYMDLMTDILESEPSSLKKEVEK